MRLFVIAVLAALHVPIVDGATIFSNIDGGLLGQAFFVGDSPPGICVPLNGGSATCSTHTEVAQSFVAGLTARVGQVDIAFVIDSPVTVLQVNLYEDAGGVPGLALETLLYTGPFLPHNGPPHALVQVASVSQPVLISGETYWIGITPLLELASSGAWFLAATFSGNPVSRQIVNAGGITAQEGDPFTCGGLVTCHEWMQDTPSGLEAALRVSSTPIPEPAAARLLGLGVLAFALMRRKRRQLGESET